MDEVIGIALLTRTVPQELIVVCRKANGRCFLQRIAAYPLGGAKPAEQAWEYRIKGDQLEVTPSLHVRYQITGDSTWHDRFHNQYAWRVAFKWADATHPDEVWEEAKRANETVEFSHGL